MKESEYYNLLSEIYEERHNRINEVYYSYSRGEINNSEKESQIRKIDQIAKEKIIHLEKEYYFSNKTY